MCSISTFFFIANHFFCIAISNFESNNSNGDECECSSGFLYAISVQNGFVLIDCVLCFLVRIHIFFFALFIFKHRLLDLRSRLSDDRLISGSSIEDDALID